MRKNLKGAYTRLLQINTTHTEEQACCNFLKTITGDVTDS